MFPCVLDAIAKLHFSLYSYVTVLPLTLIKPVMIAHNVLEALWRLANYIEIVIGI